MDKDWTEEAGEIVRSWNALPDAGLRQHELVVAIAQSLARAAAGPAPGLSAESWLAERGYADSRPHSSVAIAALLTDYAAYVQRAAEPRAGVEAWSIPDGHCVVCREDANEAPDVLFTPHGNTICRACAESVSSLSPPPAPQLYEDDGNAICTRCRRPFGQHFVRITAKYPKGVASCPEPTQ